jgi:phosphopantetheinyl transferase
LTDTILSAIVAEIEMRRPARFVHNRRAWLSFARRSSVDLWVVKLTDEGPLGLRAAHSLLGGPAAPDRRAIDDQRRSVLARAAVTRLVATRTGVDTARVNLVHDARGRPLVSGSALHLSIAHSGEFVACAVSDRRVGVDIERFDRAEADADLARRACSPVEREQLGEVTGPALIRLWTRKEAVAKLLGLGLALPFEQLDVRRDTPRIGGARASGLTVRDLGGGPDDYAVAIATEGRCRVSARLVVEGRDSAMAMPGRAEWMSTRHVVQGARRSALSADRRQGTGGGAGGYRGLAHAMIRSYGRWRSKTPPPRA